MEAKNIYDSNQNCCVGIHRFTRTRTHTPSSCHPANHPSATSEVWREASPIRARLLVSHDRGIRGTVGGCTLSSDKDSFLPCPFSSKYINACMQCISGGPKKSLVARQSRIHPREINKINECVHPGTAGCWCKAALRYSPASAAVMMGKSIFVQPAAAAATMIVVHTDVSEVNEWA